MVRYHTFKRREKNVELEDGRTCMNLHGLYLVFKVIVRVEDC